MNKLPHSLQTLVDAVRHDRIVKIQRAVMQYASARYPHGFYIDNVQGLDELVAETTPNLIGIAVRQLLKSKRLGRTGHFQRSHKKAAKGRTIFEMRIP